MCIRDRYPSEHDIKGLFADFDTTSNRLGNTVEEKNRRLAAVIKGVELSLIHIFERAGDGIRSHFPGLV